MTPPPRPHHRRAGRPPQQRQATASRQIALEVLESIMEKGMPLQDSLEQHDGFARLEPRDRRFARRLITLALRHHGAASEVLSRHVKSLPHGRNRMAGLILRMAAAELIYGDAKPHAVVDQSVRLAHQHRCGHLGGLINAVLRKIGPADDPKQPMLNLPPWLKTALITDWGEETASRMATMLMQPPALDLRPKTDPAGLAEILNGMATPHGSVRLNDGMVTALSGYEEGHWWVQDAAASLPAMLINAAPGQMIADLCAAPGGKTAQLCAAGATVTALDIAANRMPRLQANMQRLGFSPAIVTADAATWKPDALLDAVLIDAPCSATGTIRRRPDILGHMTAPDLARLNRLQRDLLEAGARMIKPGGVLVFATCSILKAEGEAIVAAIPDSLEPLPISDDEIPGFRRHPGAANHHLRIMPDALELNDNIIQGNDGFFIARFRRIREG
ncbi:MAG: RsmB/NOP family class I SAM-dependent RNA methyltransferase [Candidatus Puniceispirillales bacterium]